MSEALGRHITVPVWLHAQGWVEEDVKYRAFPAIREAAKHFDPHKGAFQTYAYYFIKGELLAALTSEDGLVVAEQVDEEIVGALSEGDSNTLDERDIWHLFELDFSPKPGGSDLGKALMLDSQTLYLLRGWLEENASRASDHFGEWRSDWVRNTVGTLAFARRWVEIAPPDAGTPSKNTGTLPIEGVAVDLATGRTVDVTKPLEAHVLKRRMGGASDRTIAKHFGVSKDKVRRWRLRMSEQGFDPSKFTLDDLYGAANEKPGPKPKND